MLSIDPNVHDDCCFRRKSPVGNALYVTYCDHRSAILRGLVTTV